MQCINQLFFFIKTFIDFNRSPIDLIETCFQIMFPINYINKLKFVSI